MKIRSSVQQSLRQLAQSSGIDQCFSLIVMLFLLLTSSGVIYAVELHQKCNAANPWSYSTALYYVNTLQTTIGYGNVIPCSRISRGLSILYVLIAIPLLLATMHKIGFHLAKKTGLMYSRLKLFVRWSKSQTKKSGGADNVSELTTATSVGKLRFTDVVRRLPTKQRLQNLKSMSEVDAVDQLDPIPPLKIGIILAFIWVVLCTVYFAEVETLEFSQRSDNHTFYNSAAAEKYFDAFYFTMISLTTVGFGQIVPEERRIAAMVLIYAGLALVSMCISIVQMKIECLLREVTEKMEKRMRGLNRSKTMDVSEGIDDILTSTNRWKSASLVTGLVYRLTDGNHRKRQLREAWLRMARQREKSTQTTAVECDPETSSESNQTDVRLTCASRAQKPCPCCNQNPSLTSSASSSKTVQHIGSLHHIMLSTAQSMVASEPEISEQLTE